jgi:hypothetical protein
VKIGGGKGSYGAVADVSACVGGLHAADHDQVLSYCVAGVAFAVSKCKEALGAVDMYRIFLLGESGLSPIGRWGE